MVAEQPGPSDAVRQARAILDRWKSSDLLDRINATEALPPLVWSTDKRPASPMSVTPASVSHADARTSDPQALRGNQRVAAEAAIVPEPGIVPEPAEKAETTSLPETRLQKPLTEREAAAEPTAASDADLSHEQADLSIDDPPLAPKLPQDAPGLLDGKQPEAATLDEALRGDSPALPPEQHSDHTTAAQSIPATRPESSSDEREISPPPIAAVSPPGVEVVSVLKRAPAVGAASPEPDAPSTTSLSETAAAPQKEKDVVQSGSVRRLQPAPWLTTTVELSVGEDFDALPEPELLDSADSSENADSLAALDQQMPLSLGPVVDSQRSKTSSPVTERTPVTDALVTATQQKPETEVSSPDGMQQLPADAAAVMFPGSTLPPPAGAEQTPSPELFAQSSAIVTREESLPVRPESAETRHPAEPAGFPAPKNILKQPGGRPRLKRRMGPARNLSTMSTGSIAVNRKFRIDQPGGNPDDPSSDSLSAEQAAVQGMNPEGRVSAPSSTITSNAAGPGAGKRFRIDAPESVIDLAETAGTRSRTRGKPKQRYIDEPHGTLPRGPHFEISPPRRSNLTSMTGQFLAYLGVLGLTVGTAIVIYGHFGGYSEYTPTGWLVTTVAQMMLFLGVINLVSGGIEQNNEDVSRRIQTLGEQLLRIENVTEQALRGPKIPAHRYANPDAQPSPVTSRQTADVD